MRIISGKHRGRKIEISKDTTHIRPTSSYARESIFNILSHGRFAGEDASPYRNKSVLDVFCGSGALGLEALSRGAAHVTFIDHSRDSLLIARRNAEHLGEDSHCHFLRTDATQLGKADQRYSLAFLDPPYGKDLFAKCLNSLVAGGWLADDALIVTEHEERETPAIPANFTCSDQRRYGRAMISLYQLAA